MWKFLLLVQVATPTAGAPLPLKMTTFIVENLGSRKISQFPDDGVSYLVGFNKSSGNLEYGGSLDLSSLTIITNLPIPSIVKDNGQEYLLPHFCWF